MRMKSAGGARGGIRNAGDDRRDTSHLALKLATVAAVALLTANCGAQQRVSSGIDPKLGVKASPRVVADGQAVPKGGGRQMVGRPYTIAGRTFVPRHDDGYSREGVASWYGPSFHGRMTANGEVFDRFSVSAAHPTMPLPSYARVTNSQNNRSVVVRVNDRGPFHGNRIIDVSQTVAEALDFRRSGTARVRVDYIGPASVHGSDDRLLLASLRTDGTLASLPGARMPVIAAAPAPQRTLAPQISPVVAMMNAPVPAPTAPVRVADAASEGRIVANVPLPPERPYDLAAVRGVSVVAAAQQGRAVAGRQGLFFAAQADVSTQVVMSDPFAELKPRRFVHLR